MRSDLDPGAYIGHEPEREEEAIPGGIAPDDERVAAYGSRAGAKGEPDDRGDAARPSDAEGAVDVEDSSANPA